MYSHLISLCVAYAVNLRIKLHSVKHGYNYNFMCGMTINSKFIADLCQKACIIIVFQCGTAVRPSATNCVSLVPYYMLSIMSVLFMLFDISSSS